MDIKWNIITDEIRNNPCEPGEFFPCLNELVLLNVGNGGMILGYLKVDKLDECGNEYSWYDCYDDSKVASTHDLNVKAWLHVTVVDDAMWRRRNGIQMESNYG